MKQKFRAWDKRKKEMFEVSGIDFAIMSAVDEKTKWSDFKQGGERKDIILQQSTGLLDKNGKEIFDGDIVKHKYAVGEEFKSNGIMVVGSETPDGFKIVGLEMFDPKCSTTYFFDANNEIQEDVEIIGNIYEDEKLIKN